MQRLSVHAGTVVVLAGQRADSRGMTNFLTPGDPGYDTERTGYNLAVDHKPEVVVPATSVDDVVAAVRYASAAWPRCRRAGDRPRPVPQRRRRRPDHHVPDGRHHDRPGRPHRAGRGGRPRWRVGPRGRRARPGSPQRFLARGRGGLLPPRRRHRDARAQARLGRRPRPRAGGRHGRRRAAPGDRHGGDRAVLGAARRRQGHARRRGRDRDRPAPGRAAVRGRHALRRRRRVARTHDLGGLDAGRTRSDGLVGPVDPDAGPARAARRTSRPVRRARAGSRSPAARRTGSGWCSRSATSGR